MSNRWARTEEETESDFLQILSEETKKQCNLAERKKHVPDASVLNLNDPLLEGFEVITDDSFEKDVQFCECEVCSNQELKVEEKLDVSKVSSANDFEYEQEVEIQNKNERDRLQYLDEDLTSKSYGYRLRKQRKMIIKPDVVLSGKNYYRKPLPLTNKISNSLMCSQTKKHKCTECRKHSSTKYVMNENTRLVLCKMLADGVLNSVNDVISVGERAVMLHATLKPGGDEEDLPKECVLKVFKSCNSKEEYKYVNEEHLESVRKRTFKSIQWWAKREMVNLLRIRKVGIRCPQVIKLKEHVLVMSFIGEKNKPAQQLRCANLSNTDLATAYEEVKNSMKTLYEKVNLIHGDLSENSILWHNGHCYFIDVARCVEPGHENGYEFLYRDCVNITNFFVKNNFKADSPTELFKFITGFNFGDKMILENMKKVYRLYPNSHHIPSAK